MARKTAPAPDGKFTIRFVRAAMDGNGVRDFGNPAVDAGMDVRATFMARPDLSVGNGTYVRIDDVVVDSNVDAIMAMTEGLERSRNALRGIDAMRHIELPRVLGWNSGESYELLPDVPTYDENGNVI